MMEVGKRCRVSPEVAARRFTEVYPQLTFIEARRTRNKEGETVFKINWSTNETEPLRLTRHRFLKEEHPIGKILLRDRENPDSGEALELHQWGRIGIYQRSRAAKLLCIIYATERVYSGSLRDAPSPIKSR